MGSIVQAYGGTERKFALPLVYALLENKTADSYSTVLRKTVSAAERFHVRIQHPQTVISDFELAIISAVKNVFSIESIRLCLFHLCQSMYRRI